MSNVFTRPVPRTDAEYEAEATRILGDIDALFERMDASQAESDRLTAETKVIKTRIDVKLMRLQEQVSNLTKTK